MTVRELIELLQAEDPAALVVEWQPPRYREALPVSGIERVRLVEQVGGSMVCADEGAAGARAAITIG